MNTTDSIDPISPDDPLTYSPGQFVWVPESDGPVLGEIVAVSGDLLIIRLPDGSMTSRPSEVVYPARPSDFW